MSIHQVQYDSVVDAAYFQLTNSQGVDSEEIADGIIVDYDKDNKVIAVELLGIKTINPSDFKKLKSLLPESVLAEFQQLRSMATTALS
jgi:uncharacterized protein YuzE